jgi:S-methyl-5-thioribose-1-phosphate isomerase
MNVSGKPYRSVWVEPDDRARVLDGATGGFTVRAIDQPLLPHRFEIADLKSHLDTARAIRDMTVRGAPAIGAAGAFGLAQAAAEAPRDGDRAEFIDRACALLRSTRPTAQDLFYALDRVKRSIDDATAETQAAAALAEARRLADESAERCRRIGEAGAALVERGMTVLTHCNAGWLACVDWGTALAPIYLAHRAGRAPRVMVDETRPRLQGANLTAWELGQEGVEYQIIADNAAGLLMRRGEVQLVITGADRIAANGDAANKIGTYEKALLAREHGVPFYVAAPASTFDPATPTGDDIPIEERSPEELLFAVGMDDSGRLRRVRLAPESAAARNPAFDVTPAALIAGFITERGILGATGAAIAGMLGS